MEPGLDLAAAVQSFSKTLLDYEKAANKIGEEALNKKGKDVVIKTISKTPKASASGIRGELGRDGLAYRLVKKTGKTRAQIAAAVRKLIAARARSASYIRAGFYKALSVLGGRGGWVRGGGMADKSTGTRATTFDLKVTIVNRTVGAAKVAGTALAQALDEVTADMMVYIQRKLAERWGR
jgi:hypothetical protein